MIFDKEQLETSLEEEISEGQVDDIVYYFCYNSSYLLAYALSYEGKKEMFEVI